MISHDAGEFANSELAKYMDEARISLSITSCGLDDHPLIYVNEPFSRLTGYGRDRIIGSNCRFMQREMREQDGRFRMRQFMRDDKSNNMRCSLINFRADGSPFVNLVFLSKLRSPNKQDCFIFASQFDVTQNLPDQLQEYEGNLATATRRFSRIAGEHQLMMDQSIEMIAQSAASIAESKLALRLLMEDDS